jgi:hypothetical protein
MNISICYKGFGSRRLKRPVKIVRVGKLNNTVVVYMIIPIEISVFAKHGTNNILV